LVLLVILKKDLGLSASVLAEARLIAEATTDSRAWELIDDSQWRQG